MKNFLGILVLSLLLNAFNLNDTEANTLKIKNRVIKTQGDVFIKWPHKWKFTYAMKYWKPHMIQEVTDKVRFGKTALRFELRSGSCGKTPNGWDDCKNGPFGSERHELTPADDDKTISFNGNVWHTISWYIEEFHTPLRGHNSIWQIHNAGDWAPMFNTDLAYEGLYWQRRTACNVPRIYKKYNAKGNDGCSVSWAENANVKIMERNEIFNKWNDVIMNINYTTKDTGYLKMWINGKLVYHYQGSIKPPKGDKGWTNDSYMQFGVYRMAETGVHPHTQIQYYDEIRYAKKKCSKLKLENLGYNCEKLENQKIKIDTIEKDNYLAVIKSKEDEKYILKVSGTSKKLAGKKGLKKCKESGKTECYVHYVSEKSLY